MQPAHLDGYPGADGQGPLPAPPPHVSAWLKVITQTQRVHSQYLPYHRLVNGVQPIPAAAAGTSQPVPPHRYNIAHVMRLPVDANQNLHRTGVLIVKSSYTVLPPHDPTPPGVPAPPHDPTPPGVPAPPHDPAPSGISAPPHDPAPSQQSSSDSDKEKCESEREDDHPYVKRPPNAFMLFVKEQRPHVEEEIKRMGNGIVNSVLGVRWHSLSEEEQVKYIQQAKVEKELHAQRHPGWSVCQNYGKKRKWVRRQPPKASMKQHVSQVASTSQAAVGPRLLGAVAVLTDVMKRHVGTQTDSSDSPACDMCHCPQV